jgi:hypothetical protein
VTFIDDYSWFPTVYFIAMKSGVSAAFRWAENVTGQWFINGTASFAMVRGLNICVD